MNESTGERFIETYSGRRVDPFDVSPADVYLPDVAAGLAHTCRFGGHCDPFYSVARHSLHVSHEFPRDRPRLRLFGLLHDAGEAYLGDVPRPIKDRFDSFERAEARILTAVWDSLNVEAPTADEWERVMAADDRLLAYEAGELLADGSWAERSPDLGYDLGEDSPGKSRSTFRNRAETLVERAGGRVPATDE